jgi:hypothetical protein
MHMSLGTLLGRSWARLFRGERIDACHPDPRVELWLVDRLVPKWACGQAWGNVILLRRDHWQHPGVLDLIAHEYVHVLQWRRYGSAFLLAYVLASVGALCRYGPRGAYLMNRFEREARGEK